MSASRRPQPRGRARSKGSSAKRLCGCRGRPGPRPLPLDELLVQEILHMHEELGWGRPRILAAMRDSGVTERQVRRVLVEHAGRISTPAGRRS